MNKMRTVKDAKASNSTQVLRMIYGYAHEHRSWWGNVRWFFEKRGWIHRRVILNDTWPTMTKGIKTPDQMYFYGTPESYVRSGRMLSATEIIRGVANLDVKTGLVWYSRPKARHHHLLWIMGEYGVDERARAQAVQGFLTSAGRFVTREEALVIAQANHQLIKKTPPEHLLFSEDLFEGPLSSDGESFDPHQRTYSEHTPR